MRDPRPSCTLHEETGNVDELNVNLSIWDERSSQQNTVPTGVGSSSAHDRWRGLLFSFLLCDDDEAAQQSQSLRVPFFEPGIISSCGFTKVKDSDDLQRYVLSFSCTFFFFFFVGSFSRMHKTMRSFVLFLARKGLTEAKEKKKKGKTCSSVWASTEAFSRHSGEGRKNKQARI